MGRINVLSLFNGMSFGMMALETCGIEVDKYYSSEIDKYANQATKALYPDIIQLGDVTKWRQWDIDWSSIDLLLAGFPCQAWSMAGKQEGDNDPRGALVHDLIAIWQHINLKRYIAGKEPVKFMFENVKMKKEFLDYINELFGVEPAMIDSGIFGAQTRKRHYWTNFGSVNKPKDIGVYIDSLFDDPKNVMNIDSRMAKIKGGCAKIKAFKKNNRRTDQKHKTLLASGIRPACSGGCNFMKDGAWYQVTPRGAAMLQTVPKRHINTLLSAGISNTQLYKMLGNGWTHDVIVHIFKGLFS